MSPGPLVWAQKRCFVTFSTCRVYFSLAVGRQLFVKIPKTTHFNLLLPSLASVALLGTIYHKEKILKQKNIHWKMFDKAIF